MNELVKRLNSFLAVKLGILEESSPRNKLDARLSTANRFVLEQICDDFRRVLQYDFSLDQVRYIVRHPHVSRSLMPDTQNEWTPRISMLELWLRDPSQ